MTYLWNTSLTWNSQLVSKGWFFAFLQEIFHQHDFKEYYYALVEIIDQSSKYYLIDFGWNTLNRWGLGIIY